MCHESDKVLQYYHYDGGANDDVDNTDDGVD